MFSNKLSYSFFSLVVLTSIATLMTPEYLNDFKNQKYSFTKYFSDYILINIAIIYAFVFMFICYHIVKVGLKKTSEHVINNSDENDSITSSVEIVGTNVSKEQVVSLGDRMKNYELICQDILTINGNETFVIRLDGRNFSKLTKNFEKPYDENFSNIMLNTAVDIFKEFNPTFIHVQSDEISVIFKNRCSNEEFDTEPQKYNHIFGGRVIKMLTIISSFASSCFYRHILNIIDSNDDKYSKLSKLIKEGSINISFDSRLTMVISDTNKQCIPRVNEYEIVNYVYWRSVIDGYRNAVSMFASKFLESNELEKISTQERINKMKEKNIPFDFNTMKNHIKYGWFIKNTYYAMSSAKNQTSTLKKSPIALSFPIKYSSELKNGLMGDTWNQDSMKDIVSNIEMMGF